jgi:hypothetical protein
MATDQKPKRRNGISESPFYESVTNKFSVSQFVVAVYQLCSRASEHRARHHVTFTVKLTSGAQQLAPMFVDASGNELGDSFAIVIQLQ